MIRGKNIEVNGLEMKRLDQGARVFGNVKIMTAGLYYLVNSTNFLVKWDGGINLYVVIRSSWKAKMQGVCGNFDYDSSNDLK